MIAHKNKGFQRPSEQSCIHDPISRQPGSLNLAFQKLRVTANSQHTSLCMLLIHYLYMDRSKGITDTEKRSGQHLQMSERALFEYQ